MKRLLVITTLSLVLLALVLIGSSMVYSDITDTYEWYNQIMLKSYQVSPKPENAIASSIDIGSFDYLLQVEWITNKTIIESQSLTGIYLLAYFNAYNIEIGNTTFTFTNETSYWDLYPLSPSGLIYSIDGLPIVSFDFQFLGVKTTPALPENESLVPFYFPIMSLWHKIQDTRDFLLAYLMVRPGVYSSDQYSTIVEIVWIHGIYNETNGSLSYNITNTNFIYFNNTQGIMQVKFHFYFIPSFYSYVEPSTGDRYLIVGFNYLIQGKDLYDNIVEAQDSFAWQTYHIAKADNTSLGNFNEAVQKTFGWDLWIGLGYTIYRSDFPPLKTIMRSITYTDVLVKAKISNPMVFNTYPDTAKLFKLFMGDQIPYYSNPLPHVVQGENTVNITGLFFVSIALGISLVIGVITGREYGGLIALASFLVLLSFIDFSPRIIFYGIIGLGFQFLITTLERG